jgi:CelD/BcsL family acetyltransferase involved in cellulose biosynthesis
LRSTGSQFAPRFALDRTASAIASARRAVLADRYAINSLSVEWRWLADLIPVAGDWRDLAARALEPNVFYEPSFALAGAAAFGRDVGAVLVWSGTSPRKLLGFFPARVNERRYGVRLPVLAGWTHPYAPLGTPLVEPDAAETVIAAWLAHVAGSPSLPGLILLPLIPEEGAFAAALGACLRRSEMSYADFGRHQRALMVPGDNRSHYLEHTLSSHRQRELRRNARRLAGLGAVQFTVAREPAAIAEAVDDFFSLEASGWKGEAGSAAAYDGDIEGFVRAALFALAREDKAAINRILLDGHAVAAAITLYSGETAWYWKTAYDEDLARHAPGMLLTAALTEELASNASVARADSCAMPGNTMEIVWRERLALCDRLIAVRPEVPFGYASALEKLRGAAIAAAKTLRSGFRRQR